MADPQSHCADVVRSEQGPVDGDACRRPAAVSVLYVGPMSGTSLHRRNAFARMGHRVTVLEPRRLLPASPWIDRIEWHLSPAIPAALLERRLRAWLSARAGERFDMVFVDNGSLIGAGSVRLLKQHATHVVNFNHDDPFGRRDGARFGAYREALPQYDLVTVVRQPNVAEALALGASDVLLHPMVSDEVEHAPRPMSPENAAKWACEVAFVGSWMPERGPFLVDLVKRGVSLALYGPRWNRSPEWSELKHVHRAEYVDGDDYAFAVQGARISLGLLSKGNRDLHTTRSMEIPSLGGLLCAERTTEHAQWYCEGIEALFWSDSAECARVCTEVLQDENRRARIALAGQRRAAQNGFTSENLISRIIDRVQHRHE